MWKYVAISPETGEFNSPATLSDQDVKYDVEWFHLRGTGDRIIGSYDEGAIMVISISGASHTLIYVRLADGE